MYVERKRYHGKVTELSFLLFFFLGFFSYETVKVFVFTVIFAAAKIATEAIAETNDENGSFGESVGCFFLLVG